MVFAAKSVVFCFILLLGLREVLEIGYNFANVKDVATKHDKTEHGIDQNIIIRRGNDNQTNALFNESSHDDDANDETKDISTDDESSSSSSSFEEEEKEPQDGHSTVWLRIWGSHIAAVDPNEDDDFSIGDNKGLWQRLSSNETSSTLSSKSILIDLFAAFPRPKQQNSAAVYNKDAYDSLISKLVKSRKQGRNFTIVASGGSTTCGAAKDQPAIPQGERYYSRLAGYLNALLTDYQDDDSTRQQTATVQWIGQGHGARTSLHTAIFFDSFIPVDTDLLLWEFSINDAIDWFGGDPELFRKSLQSDLLVWLEEVSRMKRPAMVMLIYYWNTPYHQNAAANEIVGQAFEAHASIAKEYDFVVGHVNLGSFIDEVYFPGCTRWETCPLLSDKHHASRLGHVLTAYLLLNLLNPSKELLLPPGTKEDDDTRSESSIYEWNCGVETDAKQILKQVLTAPTIGWKSPLGAWTLDLPAYDQMTSRQLVAGPRLGDIDLVDKADPIRQDRKRCTTLEYCGNGGTYFSVIAPIEPMESVQAVLLVLKKHQTVLDTTDVNVILNDSNVTTNGQLVAMRTEKDPSIFRKWPCHFSGGWSSFADTYWYIFEKPQSAVNSMALCIPSNARIITPPKIQAVAFW
ncbi:unnamed protein product [Cylindrotheca closterium]|uniref:SGNH hydrolase-type esterase domain-containing protein n=1 Tax=Cylindrotheca closterium TaxID=2856 RepID=A0AAD2G229_9STRA|nr:unnamed protein product [Cylindrotheca closterium]